MYETKLPIMKKDTLKPYRRKASPAPHPCQLYPVRETSELIGLRLGRTGLVVPDGNGPEIDCGRDLKKREKEDARETVGREEEPGMACVVSENVTEALFRTDFSSAGGGGGDEVWNCPASARGLGDGARETRGEDERAGE